MPAYALPGTEVGPRRARILGVLAVALAVVGVIAWRVAPDSKPADEIRVALITGQIGEGIAPGTDIQLDGVRVGSVSTIESAGPGRQRIELSLLGSQLFGLTNALTVDYAPGNLFGISAVDLHYNGGGSELVNGSTVDLTGRNADRVTDSTLSTLLESAGHLTNDVLTPKLAELLVQVSHDVSAFTPLLQAVGATARSFADTQQLAPSYLFDEFGSALNGLPALLTGGLRVVHSAYTNQYLSSPEHMAKYSEMFSGIQNQLLPTATRTAFTSQRYFAGFMPMTIAILDRLSASVSTPARSEQQLSDLLGRIGAAFHDTPDGPMLNASVDLDVVPGLAAPLSHALGLHPAPGGR